MFCSPLCWSANYSVYLADQPEKTLKIMAESAPRYFLLLNSGFQPVGIFSNKTALWQYLNDHAQFSPSFIGGYSKLQKFLRGVEHASFLTSSGLAYIYPVLINQPIPADLSKNSWWQIE